MLVKVGLFGSPSPHHLKATVDKASAGQAGQEEGGVPHVLLLTLGCAFHRN